MAHGRLPRQRLPRRWEGKHSFHELKSEPSATAAAPNIAMQAKKKRCPTHEEHYLRARSRSAHICTAPATAVQLIFHPTRSDGAKETFVSHCARQQVPGWGWTHHEGAAGLRIGLLPYWNTQCVGEADQGVTTACGRQTRGQPGRAWKWRSQVVEIRTLQPVRRHDAEEHS